VLAALLDLAAVDVDVIDAEQPPLFQVVQVEAEGCDILDQVLLALLEGDEDARLAVVERAADQEVQAEQRLATARAAAEESRPPCGQAASGDFVQPGDAGGRLGKFGQSPTDSWFLGGRPR